MKGDELAKGRLHWERTREPGAVRWGQATLGILGKGMTAHMALTSWGIWGRSCSVRLQQEFWGYISDSMISIEHCSHLYVYLFWDRQGLTHLSWPRTPCVAEDDLESLILPPLLPEFIATLSWCSASHRAQGFLHVGWSPIESSQSSALREASTPLYFPQ